MVEALAEAKNATKAATIEEADASTQKHKALPLRGYRYAGSYLVIQPVDEA